MMSKYFLLLCVFLVMILKHSSFVHRIILDHTSRKLSVYLFTKDLYI